MRGQELLVGRDDAGALLQGPAHPAASRIDPADDFDHRIRLRREEFVHILGPCHRRRDPAGALACDAAVEDVRELESIGELRTFSQNAGDRPAHGAKAEQRDAKRCCLHSGVFEAVTGQG